MVENANDLLIDPADGLRIINDVDQLAAFEYAVVPDVERGATTADRPPTRGCASTRRSACSSGTARRCPAT